METISSVPIAPSATRSAQGSEIRVEAAVEADHQRRAGLPDDVETGADPRRRRESIGFSQKIALPARAERSMRSAWVSVGEQMATASTAFAPRISSTAATFAPVAPARAFGCGRVRVGDKKNLAVAAGDDVAAMDLADPPCADDAEFHVFLPRIRPPAGSGRAEKKEYPFHIDLGIEFLFHSGRARRRPSRRSDPREKIAHGQHFCPRSRDSCGRRLPRPGQSQRQDRYRHRRHAGPRRGDRTAFRRTRSGGHRHLRPERQERRAGGGGDFSRRLSDGVCQSRPREGRRLPERRQGSRPALWPRRRAGQRRRPDRPRRHLRHDRRALQ